MLKDCVTYDQENQYVRVTYPTIGDMSRLKNNCFQVVGMAARYEKRLIYTGKMDNYNGVLLDYIERKTLVPVTEDEIKKQHGDSIELPLEMFLPVCS